MILPVALSMFTSPMPERTRCNGSMETGGVFVVAEEHEPRYVKSIAELVDANGMTVGWLYLATKGNGSQPSEFVQGNRSMSMVTLRDFGLSNTHGNAQSSVGPLKVSPSRFGLTVERCSY